MFNDTLWFYIIHVQVYSVTCTYQHAVESEVLPSNPMFNDTLWFYIIHVQVYNVTALINTLLNLKFYLLTRCLMTHCGFISYMYRYIVSPALINTLLNLKFYLLTRCLMIHWFYIIHVEVYSVTCTYQHVVEFDVLPSNPMFNDTLWFYIIHVQVYSITCT